MQDLTNYATICRDAARAGVEVIRAAGRNFEFRAKAPADFVTDVDLASQRAILNHLRQHCPDHAVVAEEDGQSELTTESTFWLIDPLDGTTNFIHGLPHFAVSVALIHEGQPVVGCTADPCLQEEFWAVRGQGAWLNDTPIRTSGQAQISEALIAVSLPPSVSSGIPEITYMMRTISACRAMRRLGSATLNLAYVAAGRLDGYWATSLKPWDVAAGMLLVSEAGGTLSGSEGRPSSLHDPRVCAAASSILHGTLRDHLLPPKP